MATTIQQIEVPKKARAVDTSSSLQPIGGNLLAGSGFEGITQAESTSGAIWNTGVGWTIGSGVASCDGSQSANSMLFNQDNDLNPSTNRHWEITYTITAYTAGFISTQIGGYGPTTTNAAATGTYTEIIGPIDTRSNYRLYLQANSDFIGSVDNVIVKEAINFPNNNHGQIYSGRGLEFDGIADNLVLPSEMVFAGEFTVSTWIYPTGTGTDHAIIGSGAHTDAIRIQMSTQRIDVRMSGTSNSFLFTGLLNASVWYRMVITRDSSNNIRVFLNGVESATGALVDADDLLVEHIGKGYSTWPYSGMVSDLQLWDTAWTQTDITYDYLNPESLALNGGGTALTESNLKLWYPMQDGHRGQQSYILDGANSGIVSATLDDDFSTDTVSSYVAAYTTSTGDRGTISYVSDGFLRVTYTNLNGSVLYKASTLVSGKTYKVTFRAKGTHDAAFASVGNNADVGHAVSNPALTTDWQDYEFYITANGVTFRLYQSGTPDTDQTLDIDNILIQPINDKNHATTVFYGDEMGVNGDFEHATPFTGWTNIETPTTSEVNTSTVRNGTNSWKLIGDAENDGIYQNIADQVAGRQYYSEVYVYITAGAVKLDVNGVALGNTATTGSWVKLSGTTTFASNATFTIRQHGSTAATWFVDDCSHKEVGVASGWTDADQQLHIPQTALQSYNELAWFDGVADHTVVSDHNDLSFDPMSISAWINMNDATDFPIIGKGAYNSTAEYQLKVQSDDKIHFWVADESVASCHIGRVTPTVTTQENKWIHVVGTYSGGTASSGLKIYINGVQSDDANDEAAAASFVAMENLGADVYIGRYSNTYANGAITETSLWDKELSSTEVLELFNDGKALDALTHSATANIKCYWRNNGLSTWSNLDNPGTNDGTPTSITETILIPQGVDSSRDAQGFIMNKEKSTSCLNLTNGSDNPIVDLGSTTTIAEDAAFSFGMWLKPDDLTANYIIGKNSSTDYFKIHASTAIATRIDDVYDTYTVTTMVAKEWMHLTITRAAGNDGLVSVYIDGLINGGATEDTEASDGAFDYRYIGGWKLADTFRGVIDGFLIYDSMLSAAEVLRNYNATKGNHRN